MNNVQIDLFSELPCIAKLTTVDIYIQHIEHLQLIYLLEYNVVLILIKLLILCTVDTQPQELDKIADVQNYDSRCRC